MPRSTKETKTATKPQRRKLSRAHYSRIGKMGREKQLAARAAKEAEKQQEPARTKKYDTAARKAVGRAIRDANLKKDPEYYNKLSAKAQEARKRKADAAGAAPVAQPPQSDERPKAVRRRKAADAGGVHHHAVAPDVTINYNIKCEGPHGGSGEPTLEMIAVGLATLFAVLGTATLVSMKLADMNGLTWEHTTIPGQLLLVIVFFAACTTIIRRGYSQPSKERQ